MSSQRQLEIVPREDWNGLAPKWRRQRNKPISYVFVTYTGRRKCTTRSACLNEVLLQQQRHLRRPACPDIKFSFLVGGDYAIYEGRGWKSVPSLPQDYADLNTVSVYIAIVGPFSLEHPPGKDLVQLCDDFIQYGVDQQHIKEDFTKQIV